MAKKTVYNTPNKKVGTLNLLNKLSAKIARNDVAVINTEYTHINQQVTLKDDLRYKVCNTGYSNITITITIYSTKTKKVV